MTDIVEHIKKILHDIFYDKNKLPPPPDISVTIDQTPLARVKEKRTLGIVIDEQLSFTPHIELTT